MERAPGLKEILIAKTRLRGFDLAGAVDLDPVLNGGHFEKHRERYQQWLDSGFAGEMQYLIRGRDRRFDPRLVFPEAKSILCVAVRYPAREAGCEPGPRYARYIRGTDYHDDLAERLEHALKEASQESGISFKWKVCVDTSAVLERSWASLAGLGWIGKNSLLIHPQLGSYLLLAEALIDHELGAEPLLHPNYCGNCTRCLQACPTEAFKAPGVLDANSCISYVTLEKRGAIDWTEEKKAKIGTWVAGCDICQEVCPFNTKASRSREELPSQDASSVQDWASLLQELEEEYKGRTRNSSLSRVKPAMFRRNIAIALRNAWRKLTPDEQSSLLPHVRAKRESETDEHAKLEWDALLGKLP